MSSSTTDPAIVDFILRSITTRNSEEIQQIANNMNISLREMLNAGLTSAQLNELPTSFLKSQLKSNKVGVSDLEKGGLNPQPLDGLTEKPAPIPLPTDTTPIPPRSIDVVQRILSGDAVLNEVQAALIEGRLSEGKMVELGYSLDLIDRIRKYIVQHPYIPPLVDLPPLRQGATDVYFLGMPGSGKSTMLASLLSFSNKLGLIKPDTSNTHGNKYRSQLIIGMSMGFLPNSTPSELINYIPIDLRRDLESDDYHKLNFIDIAGEQFLAVAKAGINAFKAHKDFLQSGNQKCLVFILDYYLEENRAAINEQDQSLQEVFSYLDNFGVLEDTDMIYLIVTKADLFPHADKQSFADRYIDENYPVLLGACKDAKKKYQLQVKSFPYSIGPTVFGYILKDVDWSMNRNLKVYPEQLADQLFKDSAIEAKGSSFARLLSSFFKSK